MKCVGVEGGGGEGVTQWSAKNGFCWVCVCVGGTGHRRREVFFCVVLCSFLCFALGDTRVVREDDPCRGHMLLTKHAVNVDLVLWCTIERRKFFCLGLKGHFFLRPVCFHMI